MRRNTIIIAGGALLVIVLLCATLFAGWIAGRGATGAGWDPRWDRDRHHFDAPMEPLDGSHVAPFAVGLLSLLSCLVLAGALILGGVLLARNRRPSSPPAAAEPAELPELRRRYARGEISREEFLARRDNPGG